MALKNGNVEENGNSISLKLVAEAWPTKVQPKFVKKIKTPEGKWELSNESFSEVAGEVVNIKTSHNWKTWMKEVKGFVVILQDGDERYYIDSTMSNASKDLANHLLASIWQRVVVKLYLNKTEYPTASIKLANGDFAPTALDFKGLDKNKLWDMIKAQEPVKLTEEISVEDIPFK